MRINPKKSLGQNFLVDNNIRNKIIQSLSLNADDTVLEIGSGRGELTCLIADRVDKVIALEVDRRLNEGLIKAFKLKTNIDLVNQDILKFDLGGLATSLNLKKKLKVFGNIPYYISSPIIERLLKHRNVIEVIFITVQKEFAQRVKAKPGSKDFGSFSCFVQYYSNPRVIFDISSTCFRPSPKVDSSFLELRMRDNPAVYVKDESRLFRIIRGSFNQRRKTLRNSLEGVVTQDLLKVFFKESGLNPNVRPEELSLQDFALLANL